MFIEIIVFILFVVIVLLVGLYYYTSTILSETDTSMDKRINQNTNDITTNKSQSSNDIESLRKEVANIKIELEDLNMMSIKNISRYIRNHRDELVKDIIAMDGKDAADMKIVFDTFNNVFTARSKEDDEYKQKIYDNDFNKYYESLKDKEFVNVVSESK